MATLAVGLARGLELRADGAAALRLQAAPHRCEFVREVDGVDYINDSKATNLDAVEKALASRETRPVVLIAGGKDKGFEYDTLHRLVAEKCRAVVLIGEMADRIEPRWKRRVPVRDAASSLADAVERAHAHRAARRHRPLSPGTSSFDMFKSYADRGDQFRALVHALPKSNP